MHYFYLADKDGSGTLTKQECKHLLLNTLNAKVSNSDFENLFKVTNDESGRYVIISFDLIGSRSEW